MKAAACYKSLFKMWIFTVNKPQKSRFSALLGACKVEFWRLLRQNSMFLTGSQGAARGTV
jgi:hypothetical protein